jgi:hypothetical protein
MFVRTRGTCRTSASLCEMTWEEAEKGILDGHAKAQPGSVRQRRVNLCRSGRPETSVVVYTAPYPVTVGTVRHSPSHLNKQNGLRAMESPGQLGTV